VSIHGGKRDAMDSDGVDGANTPNGATEQYRRVLAVLPRAYREQRGEEMLTTMLDAAAHTGRDRPSFGETLSVLGLSLRLRTGAPGAGPRAQSVGESLRLITLLGLLLQAAAPRDLLTTGGPGVSVIGGFLCPCLAVAALLRGWRRLGLLLLTVNAAVFLTTFPQVFVIGPGAVWENRCVMIGLCGLPVFTGLLGFHRDAPRVGRPRLWSTAMILIGLALLSDFILGPFGSRSRGAHWWLLSHPWLLSRLFEIGCVCLMAVIALGHARRSTARPVALMVAAAPLLLVLPCTMAALSMGTGIAPLRRLAVSAAFGAVDRPYILIGLYVLAAEILLAITLTVPPRRFRATMVTSDAAG
jgi:hypothetical protein